MRGPRAIHTARITAVLTPDLKQAVEELSDREGTGMSRLLREALEDVVAKYAQK